MKTRIIVAAVAGVLALPGSALAQFQIQTPSDSGKDSDSSWLAGAQLGYNWQRGAFVYGVETDIAWTNLKTSISRGFDVTLPPFITPPSALTRAKIDWYGTLRGRLGWANGPLLFYGTGGLAYGGVKLNSTFDLEQGLGLAPFSAQTSSVKTGWVLGGGIDYLWGPNTIVSVGYQYVDLGKLRIAGTANPPPFLISQTATAHASFQEVSLGISWKFPPANTVVASRAAVAAELWDGWYAGGHVGGAWGLDTTADYSSVAFVDSDARLKRDITLVGRRDDGLGIYRYRYLWSDTVYEGVMAQEVALLHPEAIVRSKFDDYLRVDYSRLGMTLTTVSN